MDTESVVDAEGTQVDWDVAVVGAGPTGLLLAAELALAEVRVVVLERRAEPDTTIKAGSINVATAEILDRRGLRPAARAAHQRFIASVAAFAAGAGRPGGAGSARDELIRHATDPVGGANAGAAFPVTGHFAGIFFRPELVDRTDPDVVAHAGVGGSTLVTQVEAEAILTEHAAGLGVEVRRGVEVTGLTALTDATGAATGVRVETATGPVRAGWVVGTDGGRSRIRHLAGIDFPGTDAETTGYQAIAEMTGTEGLRPGWTHTPTGVYSYGPVPGRILTVQFTGAPTDRSAPVTCEELQASIRLVTGVEVTVTALHGEATRWTDNARQAGTYRAGRVLLAGDAAHVHSPFSGQGLNLGAGDAVNLGWKLAATVHGWAAPGLLDTYTGERHPIGAWVLDWTRAQVALMRGDAKTARLRKVVEDDLLGHPASMTRVVLETAGVARTHDLGEDAVDPLVGRLVGDTPLADGSRLADHAHDGRFVLLDRTTDGTLGAAAAPWPDRVAVIGEPDPGAGGPELYRPLRGLLVRPDGVIAWATRDPAAHPDTAGLRAALQRWAGRASSGVATGPTVDGC